jgi:hypothetical protein
VHVTVLVQIVELFFVNHIEQALKGFAHAAVKLVGFVFQNECDFHERSP